MIKPPIIAKAEGDVFVFHDVKSAERYAEHYDVEDGVYEHVFDSEGKRLGFVVERGTLLGGGPSVRLVEHGISPTDGNDLTRLLRDALGCENDDTRSLALLVEEASVRFRKE